MTLIDFDKKELLDISHALLSYRTDSTVIREGGLTDEQKERYKRLTSLIEKVSQLKNLAIGYIHEDLQKSYDDIGQISVFESMIAWNEDIFLDVAKDFELELEGVE